MCKERLKKIWLNKKIRFFLTLIFPLIIGLLLFYPYERELSEVKLGNNETGFNYVQIPDFNELNENITIKRIIATLLSTPFDLKWYTLHIKENTAYLGNPEPYKIGYTIDNQEVNLSIDGKIKIKDIFLDNPKNLTLMIKRNVTIIVDQSKLDLKKPTTKFNIEIPTFTIKANGWDALTKILLLILAWNIIIQTSRSIYEFIINKKSK